MKKTEKIVWGWHLSVDCSGCDLDSLKDRNTIYDFVKELVEKIDMVAYGEPDIVYFGSGDKSGFTLQQLIETSNICAHFVDEYEGLFLDVFSCKNFNKEIVFSLLKKYFKVKHINHEMKERVLQNGF